MEVEGSTITEYPHGSSVIAPNQSEVDEQQYIDFREDGSFELSVTESACTELKDQIGEVLGADYAKPGIHQGTYRCFDADWCGSTCDGSYGVVLFDEDGVELGWFAFVVVSVHDDEFSLDKVEMKDPYRDDISASATFYLHKS